ncbi:hypothetical protein [Bartonella sp. 1-1C]|uniref:hypothetical protein n=1 Tax=Bartonella sp. 1-1C TaxID=515256 RepID=UPI000C05C9C8|nr:hypothetical protein [Bartonella sp. 1-1C]ATO56928.1 hypothetical protein B11Cv2_001430 [Bartonella sp. 1-1C]
MEKFLSSKASLPQKSKNKIVSTDNKSDAGAIDISRKEVEELLGAFDIVSNIHMIQGLYISLEEFIFIKRHVAAAKGLLDYDLSSNDFLLRDLSYGDLARKKFNIPIDEI